jgi:hypothetical protein
MIIRGSIALAALLLGLVVTFAAWAMNFREELSGDTIVMHLEGTIVLGDADAFVNFLKGILQRHGSGVTKLRSVVSLNSPGGSVLEAEKIANLIFASQQATSVVEGHKCLSACFMLFAAGRPRFATPDVFIGVHSASYQQTETIGSAAITVVMARSLGKMGVSPDIVGRLVQTAPDQLYRLTTADLRAMQVQMPGSKVAAVTPQVAPSTLPVYQPPPTLALPQAGRWSSSRYMAGGEIRLIDARVEANGSAIGQVIFAGSPCGTATTFLGRVNADAANLTMTIGRCGLTQVSIQRAGAVWTGSYTSRFPDAGTIQMQ